MNVNVGSLDKMIRLLVGIILIALSALGIIGHWGWVGVVPLFTGLFSTCPAYSLLGISTCKTKTS